MSKQEQTLISIYKRMSSAEIRSRLAGTGLIPLARGVAENELQQRLARADADRTGATASPPEAPPERRFANTAITLLLVGVVVLSLLAGSALLFPQYAKLIWAATIFVLAISVCKAFPLFGKIVGGLLLASPLAIFAVLIHKQSVQHWGAGEALLIYLVAIVYSGICLALGAVMYGAANKATIVRST